jgi:hypothetical protein
MTLLIAGDSFSDASDACSCDERSVHRYSWVDLLQQDYKIQCVGQVGASNYDIVKQVWRARGWTFLVVNLSHPLRASSYVPPPKRKDGLKLNMKIAAYFAQKPNTICWTPFVGYESISGVHYQPLKRFNEMYNYKAAFSCTNHHFTQEGNDMFYRWIKDQIELKFASALRAKERL